MYTYNLTNEDLESEATGIKDMVVFYLHKNGHITDEVCEDMRLNYAIIVRKPSFFSKLWKSIINKNDNVIQYILVKQVSMAKPTKEKDTKNKVNIIKLDNNKEPEKE